MSPGRVGGAVSCLLVAAWFAVGVVQATATSDATERLESVEVPSPAAARATERALDRAAVLNPDATVDVLRARFALQRRRPAEARDLLLGVVAREPANLTAWATIAIAFERTDPALAERATAQVRRLAPPVAAP